MEFPSSEGHSFFRLSMPMQLWHQPIPVALLAVAWADMAGFVGQDVLGLLQGVGVFVNDGVVAGSLFVLGPTYRPRLPLCTTGRYVWEEEGKQVIRR